MFSLSITFIQKNLSLFTHSSGEPDGRGESLLSFFFSLSFSFFNKDPRMEEKFAELSEFRGDSSFFLFRVLIFFLCVISSFLILGSLACLDRHSSLGRGPPCQVATISSV